MRLIDADTLRNSVYHEAFETDNPLQKWDSGCWIRYKLFEKLLHAAPTMDATPVVHGRWIGWNYPGDEHIECSICKKQYYEDDLYIGGNDFPKYCPNCGAKMDLKEENK
jgi:hypothetical protein